MRSRKRNKHIKHCEDMKPSESEEDKRIDHEPKPRDPKLYGSN